MPRRERLHVRDLTKRYGSNTVLDGISFALPAGTIAVVTGANGAGKSTLLRCLASLASFDGTAALDGDPLPGGHELRRAIGYLPQDVGLPATTTVSEVLDLFAHLRAVEPETADLPDSFLPAMAAPVGTLSGGQRQRLAIAIALLGRPDLLLLDEPTANLDAWAAGTLWEVLHDHRDRGATILVASPRTADVVDEADIVLTLADANIEATDRWVTTPVQVEVVP